MSTFSRQLMCLKLMYGERELSNVITSRRSKWMAYSRRCVALVGGIGAVPHTFDWHQAQADGCLRVYREYLLWSDESSSYPTANVTIPLIIKPGFHRMKPLVFHIPRCNCHFEMHTTQRPRLHRIFNHWGSVYMLIKGALRICYFDFLESILNLEVVWPLLSHF